MQLERKVVDDAKVKFTLSLGFIQQQKQVMKKKDKQMTYSISAYFGDEMPLIFLVAQSHTIVALARHLKQSAFPEKYDKWQTIRIHLWSISFQSITLPEHTEQEMYDRNCYSFIKRKVTRDSCTQFLVTTDDPIYWNKLINDLTACQI